MARYRVTAPDGTTWQVTAPDNATDAEVQAYAEEQWAGMKAAKSDDANLDARDRQARAAAAEPTSPAGEQPTPGYLTLEERQAARARLQNLADMHARQIQQLEETMAGLPPEAQEGIRDTIAALRQQQVARAAQIEKTGVGTKYRTIGSTVGSVGGGLTAGGVAAALSGGNPLAIAGAGAVGSGVGTAIGAYFGTKADLRAAQPVQPEEAEKFIRDSVIEDVIWDVGGNTLIMTGTGLFKIATNSPAAKAALRKAIEDSAIAKRLRIATKMREEAVKAAQSTTSRVPTEVLNERALAAAAREQAVTEIQNRSEGALLSPARVRGRAGTVEKTLRAAQADAFEPSDELVQGAVKSYRDDFLAPRDVMNREQLGLAVQDQAKKLESAVKARTGPTFEAAKRAKVDVETDEILAAVEKALADDAGAAGAALNNTERSYLKGIVSRLRPDPEKADDIVSLVGIDGKPLPRSTPAAPQTAKLFSARDAMLFQSGNKEKMRAMTADGAPTDAYKTLLGELNEIADRKYREAVDKLGQGGLADALKVARNDYREMMTAVFDGSVQDALKKRPEDIGRMFWQSGNVTEIKQLQDLMERGIREGTISRAQQKELNAAMVRGFLSDALLTDGASDLRKAANWTESLRLAGRNDTYRTLLAQPGMAELDNGMRVLEQAAKMATVPNSKLAFAGSGILSNLWGRLGIGLLLGYVSPPTMVMFMGAEGIARMMATALAYGDKGIYRQIQAVMRASMTGNQKALAGVRPALVNLTKWAKENGFEKDIAAAEEEAKRFAESAEQQTTPQE